MLLVGVDGCRGGWVVATADERLERIRFVVVLSLDDVLRRSSTDGIVAIDVPIGLPEAGDRACDRSARRLLGGPRASSVFPAPCRAALAASTYAEACRLNEAACGRRISRQTFNILPKIREVDGLLTSSFQMHVRECHPELVFALLSANGCGLSHGKKTAAGAAERLALLVRVLPPFDPAAIAIALRPADVARDDVVDAAACLAAASKILSGTALVLPVGDTELDGRGLRMEIVA